MLLDTIPVLVGILLAVFVNNWKESASDRVYLENSISSIVKQNQENIKELEYALERQRVFMDSLDKYLDNDDFTLANVIMNVGGVYSPDLKSTTWKFLVENENHTLVPYEFINRLSEIEKYETLVNRYNEKLGDIVFQPAFFNDPEMKRVCYILFNDFGNIEKMFVEELQAFNEYVSKKYQLKD